MNNWEVYKLLAHVRPPVSKVLAISPSCSVSLHEVLPTQLSLAISLSPLFFSTVTLTLCDDSL